METQAITKDLKAILSQRNSLLAIALLMLVSNLLLSLKVFTNKKETIIMPFLDEEIRFHSKPDRAYISMMTDLFVNQLLDISPSTIQGKKTQVLKYTDVGSFNNINGYYNDLKEHHSKFNLSTYFTIKSKEIDQASLTVLIKGVLTSKFGKEGFEEREKEYLLKFTRKGNILLLREMKEIKKEEEK